MWDYNLQKLWELLTKGPSRLTGEIHMTVLASQLRSHLYYQGHCHTWEQLQTRFTKSGSALCSSDWTWPKMAMNSSFPPPGNCTASFHHPNMGSGWRERAISNKQVLVEIWDRPNICWRHKTCCVLPPRAFIPWLLISPFYCTCQQRCMAHAW